MDKFWELYAQSAIVSGLLAVMIMFTACYAALAQIPVSNEFSMAFGGIIAYFFSEKVRGSEATRRKTGPLA